jgi:hypothetical protein
MLLKIGKLVGLALEVSLGVLIRDLSPLTFI